MDQSNKNCTRSATVSGGTLDRVAQYLPSNYHALGVKDTGEVVICGRDVAGWTLDDYVIPRLASGWMFATDTTKT